MDSTLENDDLLTAYEATRQPQWRVYEPPHRVIVLGAAGDAAVDVHLDAAAAAGIDVRRRRGGGGTVLLGPGQVVVALVTEVDNPYRNREYARAINGWLIDALHGAGVCGIEQRGHLRPGHRRPQDRRYQRVPAPPHPVLPGQPAGA